MTSSVDFKAAVRAGKLAEAFAFAMSKAVELNITTWVASRGESISREPQSGNRLRTRINLIEGTIENEIGDRFIGNGPYKELQEFHKQQVGDANCILDNNLQSLQKLFRALAILKQQQLTNLSGKQALFAGDIASTVKLQPEEGLPEKEDLEYPILTLADIEPEEEGNSREEKSSEDSSRFNNSPQQVEKLASVTDEDPQQEANFQSDLYVAVAQSPSLDSETQPEELSEDTTDTELILEQLKSVEGKKDEDWGDWMVEEEDKDDWDKWEESSPFKEVASEEEEFDLDLDSIPEVELSDTALEYALDLDRENQKNTNRPKEDNPE